MSELPTPAVVEQERMILGAICRNNERAHEVLAKIHTEDFFLEGHRVTFTTIASMLEEGKAVDVRLLADQLSAEGNLARAGGMAYVMSLWDDVRGNTAIASYIANVRDCSRRRTLMGLFESSVARMADRSISYRESVHQVEEALLEVASDKASGGPQHIFIGADEQLVRLMEQSKHSGARVGASFGIKTLDLVTTGMREEELWVLGGRPGEGKSTIALQSILQNAKEGRPVGFFSVEMSTEQVRERLWSLQSKVPYERIRNPNRMSEDDKRAVKLAQAEVSQLPIFIDADAGIDIGTLSARARLMIARDKVKLIVVDYVQIVNAPAKDERQRVTKISLGLRMLAKTQKVAVLALSQMPRPKDINKWPTKFDLKESGSLEADAAGIVMIFREVDSETGLPNGNDVLVVPKQRFGPVTHERVTFMEDTLRYEPRF